MYSKLHIVSHVITTAMHILHDSYLLNNELWPVNGFRAGNGIGCAMEDCIYIGANAPNSHSGRLYFNIFNTQEARMIKQVFHIKQIIDYSQSEGLYFEDELRGKSDEPLWFHFIFSPDLKIVNQISH